MQRNIGRRLRDSKGMTLLEIMIVLVILGGLIAILAGQVMARLKSAKVKEARIQMSEYGKALDMFYTDCGSYPQSLNDLVTQPQSCQNWGPDPYLKRVNKDPWGHDFVYTSSGSAYDLKSLGSDGRQGGKGDAKDIDSND